MRDSLRSNEPLPLGIVGCILIINSDLAFLSEDYTDSYARDLGWAKTKRLAVVSVVTGKTVSDIPVTELRRRLGIDLSVPLFICPNGFSEDNTKKILVQLVNKIKDTD